MVETGSPVLHDLRVHVGRVSSDLEGRWEEYLASHAPLPLSRHPGWLDVFRSAFGQATYVIEATEGGKTLGMLPLSRADGPLFGRWLSSLPYLNYGGVLADDQGVATSLIDRAVALADSSRSCLLLRHDRAVQHPRLARHPGAKVNVRRPLPGTVARLDASILSATRNQVKKARKNGLTLRWGGAELVEDFYSVFSVNMRDLGTPVYGISLFREALRRFPGRCEFCVVRLGTLPIAGAFVAHGWGVTEVPSASSLRSHNSTCANMLLYWNILARAVELGQGEFDFGRCDPGGTVFKFKEQWGGRPSPAEWQGYTRGGGAGNAAESGTRERLSRLWRKLPLFVSRWVGPAIVRALP